MKKEFLPYQEALDLKELGFNEKCAAHYLDVDDLELKWLIYRNLSIDTNKCIQAPLYQQAFRWFREKYNILATIYSNASGYLYEWHDSIGGTHRGWSDYEGPNDGGVWNTYEEAELACLKKLIEIVKNK
jgi:hypothetical protein